MPEPWIGFSVFTEKPSDNLRFQEERFDKTFSTSHVGQWADLEDDE
jgi:hypothetical protein